MVVVVVTDFVFATRISATAQMDQLALKITRSPAETLSELATAEQIIIDANNCGGDPLPLIREIKAARPELPVTVYLSHVQRKLSDAASEAGADLVLPRSTFTERLRDVLAGNFQR